MEISPHSDSEGMDCPDKSEPVPSASGISWNMKDSCGNLNLEKVDQERKLFHGRHVRRLSKGTAVKCVPLTATGSFPVHMFASHLKCRCGLHASVLPEELTGRLCKTVHLQRSLHIQRIMKERAAARAGFKIGSVDPDILLKALLKAAIKGIRILDGRDHKSVHENREALEKLRLCGFKSEFRLLQMLHNAKLESQSKSSSDDIAKMFEKISL